MSQSYSKYFWQLKCENRTEDLSENIKGHIRFEINEDTCSIDLNIQNIHPCIENYCYKFYLISKTKKGFTYTLLGNLEVKNHRVITSFSLSKDNFNNSGICVREFNAAAITCQPIDLIKKNDIKFLLVGYQTEGIEWKNDLLTALRPSVPIDKPMDKLMENTIDKAIDNTLKNSVQSNIRSQVSDIDSQASNIENQADSKFFEDINFRMKNLENMLSVSFPEYKLNNSDTNLIRCWKANNHSLLLRILYYCHYPMTMLFSNALLSAYYIYGYYIIYIEKVGNSLNFVYGIPSLLGVDPTPLDVTCSWKPEIGSSSNYGEFGYWLVKFDMSL